MKRSCVELACCVALWGMVTCLGLAQFGAVGELVPPDLGVRAVDEKDGYVYVLSRDGILSTFDLTQDSGSDEFTSYDQPIDSQQQRENGRALLIVDDFLYTFHNFGGIDAYNLSNPAAPEFESNLNFVANSQSAVEASGFLLAVRDTLKVLSLANPAQPELLETVVLPDKAWAIANGGGYLYVSTTNFGTRVSGIQVLDFKDAPTATPVGWVQVGTTDNELPYVVRVVGSLLVTCATREVGFWSLSDPTRPARLARRSVSGARGCSIYDRYLVTNGNVFELRAPFPSVGTFPPGQSQADGSPYGSIARPGRVYHAQSERILLLQPPPAAALPQYVDGEVGGFENRSRVILENSGETELAGDVIFRSPEGDSSPAGDAASPPDPVPFVLTPQGSFEFTTEGTGSLNAGPAEVRLDSMETQDLRVTLIYELLGNFVSVQQAGLGRRHTAYVTRNGEETTAIALYNPSPADTAVFQATLLDDQGVEQGDPVAGSLEPGRQRAIFVTDEDLFGESIPPDFRGRIVLEVQNDKPLYSLAIIQRTDGALLAVETEVLP